jgi:hypothetical protein
MGCRAVDDKFVVLALGGAVPGPGVVEGFDLRRGGLAAALLEEDVTGAVGVEGRIEIDEVDRLVGHVLPQDVEVVAIVAGVGHQCPALRCARNCCA